MDVVCPKCNHLHHFDVEVTDYKGFVCSSCHSYFKGVYKNHFDLPDFEFVKKFDFEPASVLTFLNEKVTRYKFPLYTTTIIVRRNQSTSEFSYEYVLASDSTDPIYMSHGLSYYCQMSAFPCDKLKFVESNKIKLHNVTYEIDDYAVNDVVYAEGFVFEDLTETSNVSTYQHTFNEQLFISEEEFGDRKEYYKGQYISLFMIKDFFQKAEALEDQESATRLIYFKSCILAFLACFLVFFLSNFRNFSSQEFIFYETHESRTETTQFIGQSFVLEGDPKPLIFEGISEVNLKDVSLWVKLINEKTNEVQESKLLNYYHNEINYANGIEIDFCQVQEGTYHLVFETSRTNTDLLDFKMDYRLKFGDISYVPLFVVSLIFVIIFFQFYTLFFEGNGDKFYQQFLQINYKTVLKQNYFGVTLSAVILLFSAYLIYTNYMQQCASSTSSNVLGDHTYTGSRYHYYRNYSSDGSGHK